MAGFMRLQVWRENSRYVAEATDGGSGYYPDSYIMADRAAYVIERGAPSKALWFAEYTAPGYLDHTDFVSGDTAVEAALEAFRMFGDDEDPEERSELAAVLWQCRKADRKVRK